MRVNLIDFYIPAPAAQRQVKHHLTNNTTERHRGVKKPSPGLQLKQITRQPKHLPQLLALVALIAGLIGLFINRR